VVILEGDTASGVTLPFAFDGKRRRLFVDAGLLRQLHLRLFSYMLQYRCVIS
jgi:hypothetical protein